MKYANTILIGSPEWNAYWADWWLRRANKAYLRMQSDTIGWGEIDIWYSLLMWQWWATKE